LSMINGGRGNRWQDQGRGMFAIVQDGLIGNEQCGGRAPLRWAGCARRQWR
jgi:hypothetical protein